MHFLKTFISNFFYFFMIRIKNSNTLIINRSKKLILNLIYLLYLKISYSNV